MTCAVPPSWECGTRRRATISIASIFCWYLEAQQLVIDWVTRIARGKGVQQLEIVLEPILRTMSASSNAATDATALRRLPSEVQAELKQQEAQAYGDLGALLKTTLQLDRELATMSVAKFVLSYGPAEDAPDTRRKTSNHPAVSRSISAGRRHDAATRSDTSKQWGLPRSLGDLRRDVVWFLYAA
jgi:hypothetical protein